MFFQKPEIQRHLPLKHIAVLHLDWIVAFVNSGKYFLKGNDLIAIFRMTAAEVQNLVSAAIVNAVIQRIF